MTIVRVSCDWCGTVELAPTDITLNLQTERLIYECPLCESRFSRPSDQRATAILLALEVPTVDDPPPITETEIESFVASLDRDW